MILTKSDLHRYLSADKRELQKSYPRPRFMADEIWRYEITLRKFEYYFNQTGGLLNYLGRLFWKFRYRRMSVRFGLQIPPNVCDEGLHINHWGLLIINPNARIGKNFDVHQGVNIGVNIDPEKAPVIGDNVFCGPGVKIYGDVYIADNIAIAAGSVVNRSFYTPNVTIAGVPAKIVNETRGNPFCIQE